MAVSKRSTAAISLMVLVGLFLVEEAWSGKAFRLAVSSSDAGVVLCALNTADQTTSVNDLLTAAAAGTNNLPPQVVCARHCTSQAPCHSFNYRHDTNSCQFYHLYPPTVCQPTPNCQYYQVRMNLPVTWNTLKQPKWISICSQQSGQHNVVFNNYSWAVAMSVGHR